MKILFIASEVNPLAKVGGLADVAGALPLALKRLGTDIRIVLPKYNVIDEKKHPCQLIARDIKVKIGQDEEKVNIFQTDLRKPSFAPTPPKQLRLRRPGKATAGETKIPVYLIDHKKYLGEGGVYFGKTAFCGSFAEIQRFLFFSLTIFSLIKALNWQPEIIHCNDWHTAFVPPLLKIFKIKNIKTLYTIHNLANQGIWNAREILNFLGLKGDEIPSLKEWQKGLYGEDLNLMQQGILNADFINTVSPTYAKEVLTKSYFGRGLKETLIKRKHDFVGILNGLDTETFNPETDFYLKVNYSFKNPELKKENKIYLEKKLGLNVDPEAPLLGLVSRLTFQKGIELVVGGLKKISAQGGDLDFRAVFLGTGGEKYEKSLKKLAEKFPDKIKVKIGYDAKLAQEIYAASDFFLVPSKFEPCGLTQLIALRYGAIPIVRKVGGLADTIKNVRIKKRFLGLNRKIEGNGFVLKEYDVDKFVKILKRAFLFYQDKKLWRQLQIKVMKENYSWEKSAFEYFKLYERLIKED